MTDCQPVPLVYLTDSGVRVEKSGAGRALFNRRPAECRLALAAFETWARATDCGQLTRARYWGDLVKPPLSLSHESVQNMISRALRQPSYSTADVCRLLGIANLEWDRLTTYPTASIAEPADGFKLRQRAEHIIAEARRVDQAVEALRRGDWPRLAELIAASHASCRDLYEVSCPELERHVRAGSEAGALASRLTGAGFGGCVLHLVHQDNADALDRAMKRQLGESLRLWRVEPSAGAEVLQEALAR
jgi:galactokinase